jgi:hypothetical protein
MYARMLSYSALAPCAICNSRSPVTTTQVRFQYGDRHYRTVRTVTVPVCGMCMSRIRLCRNIFYASIGLAAVLFLLRHLLGLDLPLYLGQVFPDFPIWLVLCFVIVLAGCLPAAVFGIGTKNRVEGWLQKYAR